MERVGADVVVHRGRPGRDGDVRDGRHGRCRGDVLRRAEAELLDASETGVPVEQAMPQIALDQLRPGAVEGEGSLGRRPWRRSSSGR